MKNSMVIFCHMDLTIGLKERNILCTDTNIFVPFQEERERKEREEEERKRRAK